jgi:hypothetical protein
MSEQSIANAEMDYLATPAVAAYFDAREHEAYYQAIKRAEPRRDFHERFVRVLERFIELTNSEKGAAAVDHVMAESQRIETGAQVQPTSTPLQKARARYPKGVELLGLTEAMTFESLKTAYRGAARTNHPDAGGPHDAMVAVNEAFQFAHALLRSATVGIGPGQAVPSQSGVGNQISDCASYRYKCGELLFLVALDEWNLDTAFGWLERINSPLWKQSPCASHPWRLIALTEPACKLATRLSLTQLKDEAVRALAVARMGRDATDLNYGPMVRLAEEALAGKRQTQVSIKHRRQADNALRLGVIDDKHYKDIVKRLDASAVADDMYEERLRQLLAGGRFLQDLPTDRIAKGKILPSQLVPEPGYYVTRIAQLTDAQQAEYTTAFGSQTTLPLVRKYTFVRLGSLLESVLFHPGEVDDAALEQEAETLASIHNGSAAYYGAKVAGAIAILREQSLAERQTRARLLKDVEHGVGRAVGGAIEIKLGLGGTSPLGIPLTPGYFDLILLGIGDLLTLQRTGRLPESEESRREREAWNRDLGLLRKPEVQAAREAAFAATHIAKGNPEAAAQQYTTYCEFLLSLGKSMVHVQELQLGFWVDSLTGALVRMNRYREAHAWLARYFTLPPRYRARSGPSEEDRLQKRLARCANMLHHGADAQ